MGPISFEQVVLHLHPDPVIDPRGGGPLDDAFQRRARIAIERLPIAPQHRAAHPAPPLIALTGGQHRKGRWIGREIEIELDAAQSAGQRRPVEPVAPLQRALDQRGRNGQRLGPSGDIAEHEVDQLKRFRAHSLDHLSRGQIDPISCHAPCTHLLQILSMLSFGPTIQHSRNSFGVDSNIPKSVPFLDEEPSEYTSITVMESAIYHNLWLIPVSFIPCAEKR